MEKEKTVTIPVRELIKLFTFQYEQIGGIKESCLNMAEQGLTDKTQEIDVINDIAEDMQNTLTSLIYKFDDPDTEGETHI